MRYDYINCVMRLFSQIKSALTGVDYARVLYTVLEGGGGYFQNVTRVLEFSATKVVLKGKKGGVVVEGDNLTLGKYCLGDCVINGNIFKVEGGDL